MGRPWLVIVWERGFVTEDEADEAYEQYSEWLGADENELPFEVDRLDGLTVRIYLDTRMLESKAQLVEAAYSPPGSTDICTCGHEARAHRREESLCNLCERCLGFERRQEAA